jgi:DNA-directed RNA polymerase subunit RPC12/RpoP
LPNNNRLQELSGFIENFEKLKSLRSNEITFYAHTKGVSHGTRLRDDRFQALPRNIIAIKQWRDRMYKECLSDPERIDKAMENHSCCGCYLIKTVRKLKSKDEIPWVFGGTFWWIKHSEFFSKPDWKKVPRHKHGLENYLCKIFLFKEAFELNPCKPLHKPLYTIYSPFGLYYCYRCKEDFNIHMIENGVLCPECGKRTLIFKRYSDMFY